MEWTSVSLRVFRSVAERSSFSAAAASLGYTQSAVSRQIAGLERAADAALFLRSANGARLTEVGRILLAHATQALDLVDQGYDTLHDRAHNRPRLRVGVFTTTAMVLLPSMVTTLQQLHPGLVVETREGSTTALLRSLRAGALDAAIIGQQPPFALPEDSGLPIMTTPLIQGELVVALSEDSAVGTTGEATLAELSSLPWISGPAGEIGLGTWPALPQRPQVLHRARDWMTKFALVAAGHGATTVPPYFAQIMPPGIRLVRVTDGEPVRRRVTLAWIEPRTSPLISDLEDCLRQTAADLAS